MGSLRAAAGALPVWMPQDYPQAAVPPSVCRAAAESDGRALDRRSVGMSDFWHKMGCCVVAKPPPVRTAHMKHVTLMLTLQNVKNGSELFNRM